MSKIKFTGSYCAVPSKKIKMDTILKGFINYISVPSLESVATVKVVTTLWTQPDLIEAIKKYISKCKSYTVYYVAERHDSFNHMEEKVLKKLSLLSLPDVLKSKVYVVIRPIGLELVNWMDYRQKSSFQFHNCVDSLCWTMEGIIDKPKTLKLQYINKNLENYVSTFYSLACKYCSDDFAVYLWERMSEKTKEDLNRQMNNKNLDKFVIYWTCLLKNELSKFLRIVNPSDQNNIYDPNHSIYQAMLTLSVSVGNVLATKYFWSYLTHEEISSNIEIWVDNAVNLRKHCHQYDYQRTNQHTDILCFLLSQMHDKEQQKRILQKYSAYVLEWLFLDWPWQKFLLPTIVVMWDFLDDKVFAKLITRVAAEIKDGRTTEELLKELWCDSPIMFKRLFFQTNDSADLLWKLLEIKDVESIKFVISYATTEERKQIIFTAVNVKRKLFEFIYRNNVSLLDMLIGDVLSSECEINNLRENIILSVGGKLCHQWIVNGSWQLAENFIHCFTSQEQIDNFKSNVINKVELVGSLVKQNTYELLDKFMNWCFSSEEGINQFKKEFIYYGNFDIVESLNDLNSLNKLVDWCFNSDCDIKQLKMDISQYDTMESIMYNNIVYYYNFKFAYQLLSWCFNTNEEVKQFKGKFILSELGMDMFIRFVTNYKVYDSKYSNWKLVEKLAKWFYPVEDDVIVEFKKKAKQSKDVIFGPEKCSPCYSAKGKKQALFHLLDIYTKSSGSSNESNHLIDEENDSDDSLNSDAAYMLRNASHSSESTSSEDNC